VPTAILYHRIRNSRTRLHGALRNGNTRTPKARGRDLADRPDPNIVNRMRSGEAEINKGIMEEADKGMDTCNKGR
jgi:hypothetical protein